MKNNYFLRLAGVIALMICAGQLKAQLVNCNIFLKGDYLEAGIGANGAFGTSEVAPIAYHANVSDTMNNPCTYFLILNTELGFIADPDKNGWTTGSPAFYGDYILPGEMPREGWAMADSTGSATAYASYYHDGVIGFTGTLAGANTSYSVIANTKQGVWSGFFGGDSITVVQTTTIDTDNLYLSMHVAFANLHSTSSDTFYYLRTVNPHNEASLTSGLATKLKIEHQLPNAFNETVVSATGTTYQNAYMALGTLDSRARGFIIKDSTLPGLSTLASIYAGDYANYQYVDSLTGNLGMGLVFRIVLGVGESTSLDFGYSFKSGIIDSIFGDTTITVGTLNAQILSNSQNITVYPNPTSNLVHIAGVNPGESVGLYDIIGRNVGTATCPNGQELTYSMGNLPAGMYILSVKDISGNVVSRTRVLKQ